MAVTNDAIFSAALVVFVFIAVQYVRKYRRMKHLKRWIEELNSRTDAQREEDWRLSSEAEEAMDRYQDRD